MICSMYQSDEKGITRTAFTYKLDIANKGKNITTAKKSNV